MWDTVRYSLINPGIMKKFLFIVGIAIAFSIFALGTATFAQNFGLDETAGSAGLKGYGNSVPTIAGNIIGTLLSMISVLFFVLVLYGGIVWMTARGNSELTTKAMDTIIAAVIGIIIIMGAYALTNFVFKLGGTNTGGGNGGGGNTDSPTLTWCLTPENNCIQGGGSACPGTLYATEAICNAAKGSSAVCTARGETICGNFLTSAECTQYNDSAPFMGGNYGCRWNTIGPNAPNCVVSQQQIDQCKALSPVQCQNAGYEMRCQLGAE